MSNIINKVSFEADCIPIFNKIVIVKDDYFPIQDFPNKNDYNCLYSYIYNGILYQFLLQVEKVDHLSFEEFTFFAEHAFSIHAIHGETSVYYGETLVLTVNQYREGKGQKITPRFGNNIEKIEMPTKKQIMEKEERDRKDAEQLRKNKAERFKNNCDDDDIWWAKSPEDLKRE